MNEQGDGESERERQNKRDREKERQTVVYPLTCSRYRKCQGTLNKDRKVYVSFHRAIHAGVQMFTVRGGREI